MPCLFFGHSILANFINHWTVVVRSSWSLGGGYGRDIQVWLLMLTKKCWTGDCSFEGCILWQFVLKKCLSLVSEKFTPMKLCTVKDDFFFISLFQIKNNIKFYLCYNVYCWLKWNIPWFAFMALMKEMFILDKRFQSVNQEVCLISGTFRHCNKGWFHSTRQIQGLTAARNRIRTASCCWLLSATFYPHPHHVTWEAHVQNIGALPTHWIWLHLFSVRFSLLIRIWFNIVFIIIYINIYVCN